MTQTQQSAGAEQAPAPAQRERLAVTVRKLTRADVPHATAVMARAFDDDPVVNWFCAQDKRRAARIYNFMEIALTKLTLPYGFAYTSENIEGGAYWTPPGKWKMGMLQQLMLIPAMAKSASYRRIPAIMGGMNAIEKKHPQAPHYYLLAVGVEPESQGRNIGTQLMAPVLEICDRDRVPAYLESSKERNVSLYERNGFRVTEEMVIPNGGPKVWLMWRDPK
ncbi:MAG: GNAT family N-acetyltransferase [Chloroflexi bacterium]|nr:GNAT family N-acetyltransferase [Chloroflexota bacterium]